VTDDETPKKEEEGEAEGAEEAEDSGSGDNEWGAPPRFEPDAGADGDSESGSGSGSGSGSDSGSGSNLGPGSGSDSGSGSGSGLGSGEGSGDEPDSDWDVEPDYAAEAAAWREELQVAVGVAEEEAEPKKGKKGRRKPTRAEKRRAKREARAADDEDSPRRSTRRLMLAVGIGIVSVLAAVLIITGYMNSRHYYFVCGAEQITAERGRVFPPWGQRRVSGKEWTPIDIPANTECASEELDDQEQLEEMFSVALVEQAESRLKSGVPENVDIAEEQLLQALLLSRKPRAELRDRRKKIERLRGDVEYWRAAAQIEQVVQKLSQAGDRFKDAAARRPRLNSNASAWAEFSRGMSDEIRRGPPELRDDKPLAPGARPPFADLPSPQTTSDGDAGPQPANRPDAAPGVALPPEADAAPPAPDAGLPRGGVLL